MYLQHGDYAISPIQILAHDKPSKNSLITTIIITTTIFLLFFFIPKLREESIINSTLKFLWNVLFSKSSVLSLRSWLQFNLKETSSSCPSLYHFLSHNCLAFSSQHLLLSEIIPWTKLSYYITNMYISWEPEFCWICSLLNPPETRTWPGT